MRISGKDPHNIQEAELKSRVKLTALLEQQIDRNEDLDKENR